MQFSRLHLTIVWYIRYIYMDVYNVDVRLEWCYFFSQPWPYHFFNKCLQRGVLGRCQSCLGDLSQLLAPRELKSWQDSTDWHTLPQAPSSERAARVSKTCYLFSHNEALLRAGRELQGLSEKCWTRGGREGAQEGDRGASQTGPQTCFADEMGEWNTFPLNLKIGLDSLECFSPPLSITYWKEAQRKVGMTDPHDTRGIPLCYLHFCMCKTRTTIPGTPSLEQLEINRQSLKDSDKRCL